MDGAAPVEADGGVGLAARRRDWVLDRGEGGSWALLTILWVVLVVWALRIGDSFTPLWVLGSALHLLLLPAWPILALGLFRRHRALILVAALTIVAQVGVAWPLLPWSGASPATGARVRVASLNLFVANAQLDRAARQLAADLPDVLVVLELTPAAVTAFAKTGLSDRFRYKEVRPDGDVNGVAVYSRFPLRNGPALFPGSDLPVAIIRLPSGTDLRLLAVHSAAPSVGPWETTLHAMDRSLGQLPKPWIAIGDYNATIQHRVYRDLLHGGRHDAHLMTGRGRARSWPASLPFPPLVLIDHAVLSPGLRATATRERTIAGSDHRMIVVDLAL